MLEELSQYLQKEIARMVDATEHWFSIDELSGQKFLRQLKERVQYPQVIDLVFSGHFSNYTLEEMAMSIFYYQPKK